MAFSWWMDKQNYLQLYNGTQKYSKINRNKLLQSTMVWMNLRYIMINKRQIQSHVLYGSVEGTVEKRRNNPTQPTTQPVLYWSEGLLLCSSVKKLPKGFSESWTSSASWSAYLLMCTSVILLQMSQIPQNDALYCIYSLK